MNIFSWLNKAFEDNKPEYAMTVAVNKPNAYESLLTTAIIFITSTIETKSESSQIQLWRDASAQLANLERLGLGKTVNAERLRPVVNQYNRYKDACDAIAFMCDVWARFGSHTLVMKPTHFSQVLRENNLVCGNIKSYKGELPQKALNEYIKAERNASYRLASGYDWTYASSHCHKLGLPFVDGDGWLLMGEAFCIAAPRECFEVAPKRELDPFIFTVSRLGYILIHSMWGAEAEDATIKRYEQLRDAIIGKPKMLTV